ncbi:citrate synthase [Amycolatopsis sulphurea]|uniref:citrate synthase (unknown stereospecificity) n=1 Tax=Amycolatopsis sulphurea TaxID=76022 RepID=A0A2A9FE68_9PSEU|nr:citryl-CoA lyase [Amycolatopsis sulphurea]PFG49233.1 citrate synthase [Amycolatopsis sulphurea]
MVGLTTSIGFTTEDEIRVQGYRLADELMGTVDFGSMFYLLVTGRLPGHGEAVLFNAVLVALADHGLTPSALAARLTYTGAPEAVQGAVAAGVLGAGSVFLGVFEDTGRMLRASGQEAAHDETEVRRRAKRIVDEYRAAGKRLPGIGHPIHKNGDPRTARLLELAREHGTVGPYIRLMLAVQEEAAASASVPLPLNAGGMCGAVLCDLGIDTSVLRGVAVVSRAAGVVGHLAEEARAPIGRSLWTLAEDVVEYRPLR